MSGNIKKPIHKKWWFWVIVVVVIGAIGASLDDEDAGKKEISEPSSAQVSGNDSKESDSNSGDEDSSNTNSNDVNNNEKVPKSKTTKEEKTEFGLNEKVEFEGRILEVTNVDKSAGEGFDKPKEGKEYVIVSVTIENGSDKEVSYNPFDFKMQNSQGQIESQTFTIVDNDTSLSSGKLISGGSVSGTIAFEQPIDDPKLQLIFEPSFWSNKKVTINLN